MALAPTHPGPPYFFGLTLARSGAYAETRALWVKAVALTPEKGTHREVLSEQLRRLDEFIGQGAGEAVPQQPAQEQAAPQAPPAP